MLAVAATPPTNDALLPHARGYRVFNNLLITGGTVSDYDPAICTVFERTKTGYKNTGINNMDVIFQYHD